MTEAEWLDIHCNPRAMIEQLARMGKAKGQHGQRRLCLFVSACCLHGFAPVPDKRSRRAEEIIERLADGLICPEELPAIRAELGRIAVEYRQEVFRPPDLASEDRARALCAMEAARASISAEAVSAAKRAVTAAGYGIARGTLRDIFGNPFQRTATDPGRLRWNDGTIPRLARAMYEDRRFENLPILADALEEAGCTDAAILDHSRGPGPHVRGCWVVDLLLGKV